MFHLISTNLIDGACIADELGDVAKNDSSDENDALIVNLKWIKFRILNKKFRKLIKKYQKLTINIANSLKVSKIN